MLTSLVRRSIVLLLAASLHITGYLLFLKGFFPAKTVLPGDLIFPNEVSPYLFKGHAQFDNLVLVVVDAMRSDFMYAQDISHMPFVHQLVTKGDALPFTAHASPPTVTLPRLKGITSGSTPSFLDAILNIADDNDDTQGMTGSDSWLNQLKKQGKSLRFYGDDTWLKLFPPEGYFDRYEGTNSFFVSDFTEVDNNVTRHLDSELNRINGNDVLILHYLGLDHIGHKGGPRSPYMKEKQEEMDGIIKKVYETIAKTNSLLVVMGDHGMNEIGNHGGSSPGETSPGILFASPKFRNLRHNNKAPIPETKDYQYYRTISQVDLVPTLASLLNFPIPKNSVGVIIQEVLDLWSNDQRFLILKSNLVQLAKLAGEDIWTSVKDSDSEEKLYEQLKKLLSNLQSVATEYKYFDIICGLLGLLLGGLLSFALFASFWKGSTFEVALHYAIVGLYSVHFHASSLVEEEHQIWWLISISLLAFYCYLGRFKNLLSCTLILLCLRIIRTWSNSGQKYKTQLTLGEILLNNSNVLWILVTITYALLAVSIFCQGSFIDCLTLSRIDNMTDKVRDFGTLFAFILIFVTCSVSLLFKLCQWVTDGHSVPNMSYGILNWICESYGVDYSTADKHDFQVINTQLSRSTAWLVLSLLLLRLMLGNIRGLKAGMWTDVANITTVLLLHQTRVEHIPMFLVFFALRLLFARLIKKEEIASSNLQKRVYLTSIMSFCAQQLSFFSMGGTNLLATVDLSNAYNGVSSYDVIIVGLLTFASNFSGPIFWVLSSYQLIFDPDSARYQQNYERSVIDKKSLTNQVLLLKAGISLLFYSLSAVSLAGSCVNLRYHLFIWSVFSPKLLYFGVWTVFMNLFVELIMSTLTLLI